MCMHTHTHIYTFRRIVYVCIHVDVHTRAHIPHVYTHECWYMCVHMYTLIPTHISKVYTHIFRYILR